MICNDCGKEIEVGDRYIVDSVSGFLDADPDPTVDGLVAEVFGSTDGILRYCEDCTEPGGRHLFETNYGETA